MRHGERQKRMDKENSTKQSLSEKPGRNDRIRAILQYMLKHNERHAEQLEDLIPFLSKELGEKLREAIGVFDAATARFGEVLDGMNEPGYDENTKDKVPAVPEHKEEHVHGSTAEHTHTHVHDPKEKKRQLARLSRVIGHLEYVRRMLQADEDCSDVLIQISASKSALNGLGKQIITEHIAHCVTHAVEEGDTAALEEFRKAIDKYL